MARPIFQLGPRLSACAAYVRENHILADIGTDHAYLPVWLLKNDRIPRAIAVDLRPGPLARAQQTLEKYGETHRVRLMLSDGLDALQPGEAQDIVIAGMGGELILRILSADPACIQKDTSLILQPMTAAYALRKGLASLKLGITSETAVLDSGKVYSVMTVRQLSDPPIYPEAYFHLGLITPGTEAANAYIHKVSSSLNRACRGLQAAGREHEAQPLRSVLEDIARMYAL